MIEVFVHAERTLAIIIRAEYAAEGIKFFTPDDFSQQLAYMNRPNGYSIQPHVHNPVTREVHFTKEVLFIKSGKLRWTFMMMSRIILKVVYFTKAMLFYCHLVVMVLRC